MISDGSYPTGIPPWASDTVLTGHPAAQSSLSLFPNSYSAPLRSASASSNQPATLAERKAERQKQIEETQKGTGSVSDQASPLHRIAAICPTIEKDVSKALVTTSTQQRAQQFQKLSQTCPGSVDIWYWQAKDYFQMGQFFEAKKCIDKALVVDGQHRESLDLAQKIKHALQNLEREAVEPFEPE